MNKERILQLADKVETLEYAGYSDTNGWGGSDTFTMETYEYNCGSPACLAGWTVALFDPSVVWEDGIANIDTLEGDIEDTAAGLLDLDWATRSDLFRPAIDWPMDDGDPDEALTYERGAAYYGETDPEHPAFISPERAAATLRRLAETGFVDWSR